jgi:hypothetical protein
MPGGATPSSPSAAESRTGAHGTAISVFADPIRIVATIDNGQRRVDG